MEFISLGRKIKKMKENNDSYKGRKIRVLIISDRLFDRAQVLAEYLQSTGSIEVVGLAVDRRQALLIAQEHSFDYLIIAGYLKAEYSYSVISELQRQQRKFLSVQWSMLDSLIAAFCQRYRISLKFERTRSMEEFARFLEEHIDDPIPPMEPCTE
jgi:PleD family two-component response regulator